MSGHGLFTVLLLAYLEYRCQYVARHFLWQSPLVCWSSSVWLDCACRSFQLGLLVRAEAYLKDLHFLVLYWVMGFYGSATKHRSMGDSKLDQSSKYVHQGCWWGVPGASQFSGSHLKLQVWNLFASFHQDHLVSYLEQRN